MHLFIQNLNAYFKSTKTTIPIYVSPAFRANIAAKPSLDILHARLGHSSLFRMKYVDSSMCSHLDDFFL